MLFPQEHSFATLSCINSSSSSLCNSHMGFYLQILSPQNFNYSKTKPLESVTQTKWNSRANPSYTSVKVLKPNKLYQHGAGKIMYNLYHKQHPCNLNQYFAKSNVMHSRRTRSSTSLMLTIPFVKSTKL